MGGIWGHGGCPHTHAHACTCTHAHLYMYRNYKWPPTWRHPCLACLTCMCACVHVCVCVHAWDTPHTPIPTPTPSTHPPAPRGVDPWNHLKFNNTSTYKDISIPFEDLNELCEEFPSHGWMCGLVGGWVVGWVDGWGQVKSLKI